MNTEQEQVIYSWVEKVSGYWYGKEQPNMARQEFINVSVRAIKQAFKSAATPPDVEQIAEDSVPEAPIEYNNEESFAWRSGWISGFPKGYQAGQSAGQDATPQEWERLYNQFRGAMPTLSPIPRTAYMRKSADKVSYLLDDAANRCTLIAQQELSTLRSELSAAQDENKRLKEKLT